MPPASPHPDALSLERPDISKIQGFENTVKSSKLLNHICGGLILVGLMGTSACIYKMMRAQQMRNNLECLHWQRMRVAGQGFTISAMTIPLILPHLSSADFLLRTTSLPR